MKKGSIAFLLLVVFAGSGFAKDISFKWGIIERLRQEYLKNWKDMENSTGENDNYFRIRTSIWGKLDFDSQFSVYAKLTNEFKPYVTPSKRGDIHELVFDNLYVDLKNIFDSPWSLRIGRQNIIYGEGFLFIDGTPLDGSRTIYYNAIKATFARDKLRIDFLGVDSPRQDEYFPIVNNRNKNLVEAKERGIGYYAQYDINENWHLEQYYFYKTEKNYKKIKKGVVIETFQKTKLNTIGGRIVYKNSPWRIRSELAYQFGDYGTNDREGLGGYGFVDYTLQDVKFTPTVTIGGVYLSGDDPSTSDNESWDPLFSRWPYKSELYCYILSMEKSIAYWANMQLYKLGLNLKPTEKDSLDLAYMYLRANENTYASQPAFSNDGKERGHILQLIWKHTFNKNLSGHIQIEYFHPGDYYVDTADDALFLRWQLLYKF
ncbi:MAG: hypothetical protein B6D53_00935 [Candidatus Omnitrophica bacterium 4484_49]|nr:MAG: hypothetical protein B6D53_00935 [Candidatus Omnitrophica bacterium 4484_49]